jgi:predicted acylesterase/phospholipase RssA
MGIQTGKRACAALQKLLDHGHDDQRFALQDLLDFGADFTETEPEGWLWRKGCKRPGLRDPKAYEELAPAGSELSKILHLSPAEALQRGPENDRQQDGATSAATAAVSFGADIGNPGHSRKPYSAAQIDYLRKSIDVTMKGGIASGVIYPLALCELAREFRIRNVGGASAGAIAASFAAAAELGRARTTATDPQAPVTAIPSDTEFARPADPSEGRCRQGFAGLADIIAWLAQVDDDEKAREEFRTAQLFKPVKVTLPIFRMLAALMRNRLWTIPFLLATSFGAKMRYSSLAFVLVLPAVLLVVSRLIRGELPVPWLWAYAVTTLWLFALSLTFFGFILGVIRSAPILRAWRHKGDKEPPGLELPIPDPKPKSHTSPLPAVAIYLLGVVILVVVSRASVVIPWVGYPNSVLAWLIGILAVLGMAIASLVRLLGRGKIHRYGLIGGVTRQTEHKSLGSPFSRLMGMPRVTVGVNLTDWLDQCLSDLSGITDVLRFGHLWSPSYEFGKAGLLPELDTATFNADHRLVNLELMVTELVHRVPYKFPLDDGDPELYFRKEDLAPIFPERVIEAMCVGGPDTSEFADAKNETFIDVETGDPIAELYRLPKPRDLPVVFAVRISMAFPGLFEAIRLYRRAARDTLPIVRDDFGAPIAKNGIVLTYPKIKKLWIQELWFSDGGITSNFPIHFFDTVLPLWPTVGINLGPHPKGFGHQDVYLPTDRQASQGVPVTMGPSVVSMFAALFDTARNWRDTAQTFMPASRGRVAWIRQRKSEGGLNLFMPHDCIATLALRGAVGGARLRRRFAAQGQWQRHQWLRLRVA